MNYENINALIESIRLRPESYHGGDFAHAVDPFGFGRLLLGEANKRIDELETTRSKLLECIRARDALLSHVEEDNERLRILLQKNSDI